MRGLILFGILVGLSCISLAQENKQDSTYINQTDTTLIGDKKVVEIESKAKRFDPRRALLLSAIFPGAGQVYNKKYWKLPLVYGGFTILITTSSIYHDLYTQYRKEFFILVNDSKLTLSPSGYTKDQLRRGIDRARRERDYFIILNGFWYILQMVDAHVDAHLKEFDLNPQLQVRLEPMMESSPLTGLNSGISLKIKF